MSSRLQQRHLASVPPAPSFPHPPFTPLPGNPHMKINCPYLCPPHRTPTAFISSHHLGKFQTMHNLLFHQCLMQPGLTPLFPHPRPYLARTAAHARAHQPRLSKHLGTRCILLLHRPICNRGLSRAPAFRQFSRHLLRPHLSPGEQHLNARVSKV
jgi:hypothetical protein